MGGERNFVKFRNGLYLSDLRNSALIQTDQYEKESFWRWWVRMLTPAQFVIELKSSGHPSRWPFFLFDGYLIHYNFQNGIFEINVILTKELLL